MTECHPRLFHSDCEVVDIGEGLLERTLPRSKWTHEAHLAASTYLLLRRADIDLDHDIPNIIRRYNESFGGVNNDKEGYHETITRVFLHGVRLFLSSAGEGMLHELVNNLLLSPMGKRDWPLRFYGRERLFSKEARLAWAEPDIGPLPALPITVMDERSGG